MYKSVLIPANMFAVKVSSFVREPGNHAGTFKPCKSDMLRYQEFLRILGHPELKIIGLAVPFNIPFYHFYAFQVFYRLIELQRCKGKIRKNPETHYCPAAR